MPPPPAHPPRFPRLTPPPPAARPAIRPPSARAIRPGRAIVPAVLAVALFAVTTAVVVVATRAPSAPTPQGHSADAADGPATGDPGAPPDGPTASPDAIAAVTDAARDYLNSDQLGKASTVLTGAIDKHPGEQRLHALLGEVRLAQNDKPAALDAFERACFIGPDSPAYRDFAAAVAFELGQHARAEAHWARAQTLDPANPKYPLYRAQAQRALDQPDAARANLVIATRLDPAIPEAWATLADLALAENRPAVALNYIDNARDAAPLTPPLRILEARALRRQNNPREAADRLLAVPEADLFASPALLAETAVTLNMLGEPARAADLYTRAAGLFPEGGDYAYQAALQHQRAGDPDAARRAADRAVRLGHPEARALLRDLDAE